MAHDIDTVLGWRGRTVRDSDGDKIGTLGDLYLDGETDRPAWAGVKTGLLGRHESIVPLSAISEAEGDLVVPYGADQVKGAPSIDPDVAPTAEEEQALYAHYGEEYGQEYGHQDADQVPEPRGENEVVRSEEEVRVSEGPMRPKERVRLRKVLVTDHVQQTVPVRKEVVQVDTEPAPEGRIESVEDAGDA